MITLEQNTEILSMIPHRRPFRFIDEILDINENFVRGTYTYRPDEFFYNGHFPDNPVTPGVILTETMAQIGLIPLGIYLLDGQERFSDVLFTSSDVRFLQVVYPGRKVIVESNKIYFRHHFLKCDVKMYQESGRVVCSGKLCGMFLPHLSQDIKPAS
jgi:3-hydroxyacyl-[acyl-carrier-protein] dehydratase